MKDALHQYRSRSGIPLWAGWTKEFRAPGKETRMILLDMRG